MHRRDDPGRHLIGKNPSFPEFRQIFIKSFNIGQTATQNDDIGEDDITSRIEADEKTVEMPAKDRTKAS